MDAMVIYETGCQIAARLHGHSVKNYGHFRTFNGQYFFCYCHIHGLMFRHIFTATFRPLTATLQPQILAAN